MIVVVAIVSVAYGAGVSFTALNAIFDDCTIGERLFILFAALTWPVTVPICYAIFVGQDLLWKRRFKRQLQLAIKADPEAKNLVLDETDSSRVH